MSCNRGLGVKCFVYLNFSSNVFSRQETLWLGSWNVRKTKAFCGGGIDVPRCPNAVVVAKGGGEEGGEDEDLLNYLWRQTNQPCCRCCCVLNSPKQWFSPPLLLSLFFGGKRWREKRRNEWVICQICRRRLPKKAFRKMRGYFSGGEGRGGKRKRDTKRHERVAIPGSKVRFASQKGFFPQNFFPQKKKNFQNVTVPLPRTFPKCEGGN